MKAMVRDDIIALETFVALRFKYEEYIYKIHECGGYCFLDQFKQHYDNGRYLAKQLEENGLIKTKSFNNYKYCYLTDASIKYLYYKDDPRDFSEMKKANIPIKKLTPNPSERVLFASALKFALIHKYKLAGKEEYKSFVKKIFSQIYVNQADRLTLVENAVNKSINYYDKSKIIFTVAEFNGQRVIQMLILDTSGLKSASSYLNLARDYCNTIKFTLPLKIGIISTSSKDSIRLRDEFNKKIETRKLREGELRERYKSINIPQFEVERLNNEIPEIADIGEFKLTHYMEHYRDKLSNKVNYIKPKDIDRLEELRERFKNMRN